MTRKSVQGGYCDWPDSFGCALTKLECDDPANFRSSRQMQDGPVMAHGGSCRWQEEIKETVLGQCSSNKDGALTKQCATDVGACPPDNEWKGPKPECTVATTSFGRCDYGMCAWSHNQCTEDNTWAAFDVGCTCDKVQVGGCSRLNTEGEKVLYCAVSEDACDDEQSWIKAQEVKTAVGFDCFLCREESPAASSAASSAATTNTASSNIAMTTESDASNISAAGTTIIIVCSIVGSLFVLFIVGLVMWRVFRTKRAVKRAAEWRGKEEEETPPATAIEVNNFGSSDGGEYGRGDSADMENASILSDDK